MLLLVLISINARFWVHESCWVRERGQDSPTWWGIWDTVNEAFVDQRCWLNEFAGSSVLWMKREEVKRLCIHGTTAGSCEISPGKAGARYRQSFHGAQVGFVSRCSASFWWTWGMRESIADSTSRVAKGSWVRRQRRRGKGESKLSLVG